VNIQAASTQFLHGRSIKADSRIGGSYCQSAPVSCRAGRRIRRLRCNAKALPLLRQALDEARPRSGKAAVPMSAVAGWDVLTVWECQLKG